MTIMLILSIFLLWLTLSDSYISLDDNMAMEADLSSEYQVLELQASICTYDLPQSEYNALYSFYISTNGPHWCNIGLGVNPWVFPSDLNAPCVNYWVGITCICNSQLNISHVNALSLTNNCIFGELTPDIKNLTLLSSLSIFDNALLGTIPLEITTITGLSTLYLSKNYFSGDIYFPILQMPRLLVLDISNNLLSGYVPNDFTNASSILVSLSFSNNYLHGQLSPTIVKMKSLLNLIISLNYITGSIPAAITGLRQLQAFEASTNQITGTIPVISTLTTLQNFLAADNLLHGDLSPIANSGSLRKISFDNNKLTGSLNILTSLKRIAKITLASNYFVGTIPTSLFALTGISTLSFSNNYLTSSLPNITKSLSLQTINLSDNHLTGIIPASYSLVNIITIDISNNYFSGSIETIICPRWKSVSSMSINSNSFAGTFPSTISLLSNLQSLIMNNNLFSGNLPSTLIKISLLNNLYLYNNFLSSTIPSELGQLKKLAFIWFSNNLFQGTLPQTFLNLPLLTQILVDSNQFTGNPFSSFNASSNPLIQVINIAENLFTGSIDRNVFDFPKLLAFSAVSNCLSGSLPDDICDSPAASSIQVIALDGVSGNTKCPVTQKLNDDRPSFISGTFQSNSFRSSIPSCLMQLPALQTLHLSGNELYGTIPQISSNSTLVDLSLSNNKLTGSIHSSIQLHDFNRLDLASNRLGGSLERDFHISANQTILTLAVNRISGPLPSSIINIASDAPQLTDLNVLTSNIFSCTVDEIPQEDLHADTYSCGSYPVNVSCYTWISLVGVLSFTLFVVYRILKPSLLSTYDYPTSSPKPTDSGNIETTDQEAVDRNTMLTRLMKKVHSSLKLQADLVILWILTATIPFQEVAKQEVRASIQRLSVIDQTFGNPLHHLFHPDNEPAIGREKANLEFPSRTRSHARKSTWPTLSTITMAEKMWLKLTESRAMLILFVLCRYWSITMGAILCLVLIPIYVGLNAIGSIVDYPYAYVISVAFVHGYGPVIVCGLSVVLILWFTSSIIIPLENLFEQHRGSRFTPSVKETKVVITKYFLIYAFHLVNLVVTVTVNAAYVSTILNPNISRNILTVIQISVSMFKLIWNSIFIPWSTRKLVPYMSLGRNMQNRLIMSLTNFIVAPGIALLATNQSCFYYAFVQHDSVTSSANISVCLLFSIDPSGQIPPRCSQTATTAFFTLYDPPFQYSYACGTAMMVTYAPILLYSYMVSGLLIPMFQYVVAMYPQILKPKMISCIKRMLFSEDQAALSKQGDGAAVYEAGESEDDIRKSIKRIKGRGVMVSLIVHMTMLLTYGIAIPLVGITVIVTILTHSFIWKMLIGRYVSIVAWSQQVFHSEDRDLSTLPMDLAMLENDCRDSWQGLFVCYLICVVTISTFWALLFFDMVADPFSDMDGYATTISYGLGAPLLLIAYHQLIRVYPQANVLLGLSQLLAASVGIEQVFTTHRRNPQKDKASLDLDEYIKSMQPPDSVEEGIELHVGKPNASSIFVNRSSESKLDSFQANESFAVDVSGSRISPTEECLPSSMM
jgi:Leucine-rich repeat (LRR) protein